MIIYVDIDETICNSFGNYKDAIPITTNIEKINKLYDDGHTIVYWTARGSLNGIDYRQLTEIQLRKWSAKYHQLLMNKPFYDLFIDDKALNNIKDIDNVIHIRDGK